MSTHCDTSDFQAIFYYLSTGALHRRSPPAGRSPIAREINACWHKAEAVNLYLLGSVYSQDFSSLERFGRKLKSDFFTDFHTRGRTGLKERIVEGLSTTVLKFC